MSIWFSSDYHLGHFNIISYTQRGFKSLEQMNNTIIRNHNARVKDTDTIFFLGDFCFRNTNGGKEGEGSQIKAEEYIKLLNGRFVFIEGNHDNNNGLRTPIKNAVIELGGFEVFLTHNPEDYNEFYAINLCGHIHKQWKFQKVKGSVLVNVGCDVWDYKPININEILAELFIFLKNEHPSYFKFLQNKLKEGKK